MSSSDQTNSNGNLTQGLQAPEKNSTKHPMIQDEAWLKQAGFGLGNFNQIETSRQTQDPALLLTQAPIGNNEVAMPVVNLPRREAIKTQGMPPIPQMPPHMDLDMAKLLMATNNKQTPSQFQSKDQQNTPKKKPQVAEMSFDAGLLASLGNQFKEVAKITNDIPTSFFGNQQDSNIHAANQNERANKIRRQISDMHSFRGQENKIMHTAQQIEKGPDRQQYRTFKEKLVSAVGKLLLHRGANYEEQSGNDKAFVQRVIDFREQQLNNALKVPKGKQGRGGNTEDVVNATGRAEYKKGGVNIGG